MTKVYHLIILCILLIKRMVSFDGNSHLAFQKALRYSRHRENYKKSLQNGVIPPGLLIKKQPAFITTTEDFYIKLDSILYDAQRRLVELLLVESEKVVAMIEIDINNQLTEEYSTDASKKREELERGNENYRRELQRRRRNKWKKFKTKYQKSDRSRIQKVPQTAEQNHN